jgi:biopolymer transport protein ExbB
MSMLTNMLATAADAGSAPLSLEGLRQRAEALWQQAITIWIAGEWGMVAIAVNAFVLFALGTHIWLKLNATGAKWISDRRWRGWVERPETAKGPVGAIISDAMGARNIGDSALVFEGVRTTELPGFERDLKVMKICVGTAPLLGLFGTVTGMLTTFSGLAQGSGGEKTMSMIAKGISEALITTETGLVVALPGLFLHYHLSRGFEKYKAFLARVEAACGQAHWRRVRAAAAMKPHDELVEAAA